jgi:hypothetical protein
MGEKYMKWRVKCEHFGKSLTTTLRGFDVVTLFVQIGGNNIVAKIWTSMEQNERTFGKDL